MHFYIDGYNLLFRLMPADRPLREHREELLSGLGEKAAQLSLSLTVVFDASYHKGQREEPHTFHSLLVVFTPFGLTADEWIVHELETGRIKQVTVVTSDKGLARHAKSFGAHVQSVENFVHWINVKAQKKARPKKKESDLLVSFEQRLKAPPCAEKGMGPEYARWLRLFSERLKRREEE